MPTRPPLHPHTLREISARSTKHSDARALLWEIRRLQDQLNRLDWCIQQIQEWSIKSGCPLEAADMAYRILSSEPAVIAERIAVDRQQRSRPEPGSTPWGIGHAQIAGAPSAGQVSDD